MVLRNLFTGQQGRCRHSECFSFDESQVTINVLAVCLSIHIFMDNWVVPVWTIMSKWKSLSCVWLFVIPWTVQSMEFSRPNTGVGSHSLLQQISQPRDQTYISYIAGRFFTSWATREAQKYWSGQPIPSPADLLDPEIKLGSPALRADSLPTEPPGKPIMRFTHHE